MLPIAEVESISFDDDDQVRQSYAETYLAFIYLTAVVGLNILVWI